MPFIKVTQIEAGTTNVESVYVNTDLLVEIRPRPSYSENPEINSLLLFYGRNRPFIAKESPEEIFGMIHQSPVAIDPYYVKYVPSKDLEGIDSYPLLKRTKDYRP